MTKTTKKLIAFIIGGVFLLLIAVLILWGSHGGKEWDTSKWFNYWGKGAPITTTVSADQDGVQTKAAANSGITHDSELSAPLAATVNKYDTPSYEFTPDGIKITTNGAHGPQFAVVTGNIAAPKPTYFTTFNYDDSGVGYISYALGANGVKAMYVYNLGSGDYLNSDDLIITGYFYGYGPPNPADVYSWQLNAEMSGTTVKVPYLTEYTVYSGQTKFDSHLGIEVIAGSADDLTAPRDIFNRGVINYGVTGQATITKEDDLDGSPFSIIETDDEKYVEIDLTALSFVDTVYPICTVLFRPYVTVPGSMVGDFTAGNPYDANFVMYTNEVHFGITRLAAPQNISYSNGTLSWDAVDGAEGYAVFDGNDQVGGVLSDLHITIQDMNILAGDHVFRVRALGNVGAAKAMTSRLKFSNASNRITQIVAVTYSVGDDAMIKFIPYGSSLADYLYEVNIPNKEFGGWFYDSGYSLKVNAADVVDKDMTVYARLSDVQVTERPLTWWEKNMWYVIGAVIGLVAILIVAGIVVGVKKQKA